MILEKAFFFRTDDRPLYGVLLSPDTEGGGAPPSGRGLVVCDSLFEEKFWCERVTVNLGRRLARQGHTVLIFDYHGYGNSSGDSADVTVAGIGRDIDSACDVVRGEGARALSLLGIRWGAAPAVAAAAARGDVDSVFLVNPVDGWKRRISQALRANVAGQYAIFRKVARTREQIIEECLEKGECAESGYRMNNIDGYVFSSDFYREASEVSIPVDMPRHIRAVTVFTVPEKSGAPQVEDPLVARMNVPGGRCEGVFLGDDNAFWINNRIFTSFTPGLFAAVEERMAPGPESAAAAASAYPPASASFTGGGVRETAVDLKSSEGHLLKAVIYEPDAGEGVARRDYGFVFTHGGLIGMNGAFRFNTRAARRFASAGFPCVCADTHGVGRSGGVMENQEQRVLFRRICDGLFASDVHDASVLLKEKAGVSKAALFGVCGGAITNILAHARFADVDESVLLSVPVMLPSLDYNEVRMTEGYARFFLGMYVSKIFNPRAWWRFITFQSENRVIMKSLWVAATGRIARLLGRRKKAAGPSAPVRERQSGLETAVPGIGDDLQFNPAFLDAFRTITGSGRRIYFIFGEHDNFKWEFESEFLEGCRADVERAGDLIKIDEITHANHMYTLREWQDLIIDRCIGWAGEA